MGSGEEGCVPSPRVPEECQTFKGCFLRLRKMFAQIKGETYLIPADGWVAEQLVSRRVGSQCSLGPREMQALGEPIRVMTEQHFP